MRHHEFAFPAACCIFCRENDPIVAMWVTSSHDIDHSQGLERISLANLWVNSTTPLCHGDGVLAQLVRGGGDSGDEEERALAYAAVQALALPSEVKGQGPFMPPTSVAVVAAELVQGLTRGPMPVSLCTRAAAALCNLVAAFPSAAWVVRL